MNACFYIPLPPKKQGITNKLSKDWDKINDPKTQHQLNKLSLEMWSNE